MKKILLSFLMVSSIVLVRAQTVLNEIYSDPGNGKQEFFELYNSSTNPIAENLNCYTLVTFYKSGSTLGFYVLDLPNLSVGPKSFFTGSSATPFNVQSQTGVNAGFSWNTMPAGGSLKFYEQSGSGYLAATTPAAGFNDFFHTKSGGGAAYAIFLFKNGAYINGFLGGYNSGSVETLITSMPNLPVDMDAACGDFTINWATITSAENTTANGGTDNGYARSSDGACGTWVKTSSSVNHTPNISNGSASGLTGSLSTAQLIKCGEFGGDEAARVEFNIVNFTGSVSFAADFPVEVQMYYDIGSLPGELDGGDIAHSTSKFVSDTAVATIDSMHFSSAYLVPDIILVYKTKRGCYDKLVALSNPCSPLPINLKLFTAARVQSNISLIWETSMEENNRGFDIQRKIGNGAWASVGFVSSKAINGNSTSSLNYQFTDINGASGISQYRLRQLDVDGKSSFSAIRSVRGEGQKNNTIVYPNPSSDGKVNVVFEEVNVIRNVTLIDMNGRTIKQWKGVTNNNIQIENLTTGFYSLRIVNAETGEQTVEKIMVNKR